jgi:hypothetical protein
MKGNEMEHMSEFFALAAVISAAIASAILAEMFGGVFSNGLA